MPKWIGTVSVSGLTTVDIANPNQGARPRPADSPRDIFEAKTG
jgi:hypothetical protein